jgi:uncharacterized phage-associated protein
MVSPSLRAFHSRLNPFKSSLQFYAFWYKLPQLVFNCESMTQPAKTTFDEKKAAEVAFFFLSKAKASSKSVTKLRLVKWVYLAERLSYQRYGEPLTGDRLFSMMHGPVPSSTLYLIEAPNQVNERKGHWESVVQMTVDKGNRHQYLNLADRCCYRTTDDLLTLSDSEIEILEETWDSYGSISAKALERLLHNPRNFPEWEWRPGDPSKAIHLERLLEVLGYDHAQTSYLIENVKASEAIDRVFAH